MEYKIIKVQFIRELSYSMVETREVVVGLDNGTEVHITPCYESWQQWNATKDELATTVDIADLVNDWLHGETDEIPTEVYNYINR